MGDWSDSDEYLEEPYRREDFKIVEETDYTKEILQKGSEEVKELAEKLSIPLEKAFHLYFKFGCNIEAIMNAFLMDDPHIHELLHQSSSGQISDENSLECKICFDQKEEEELEKLSCNHPICKDCIFEYFRNMVGMKYSSLINRFAIFLPHFLLIAHIKAAHSNSPKTKSKAFSRVNSISADI